MAFWILLLQIVPLVALLLYYVQQKYNFWLKLGVNGPKPVLFLGNLYEEMSKGLLVVELEWFRKYGKVYGTYSGWKPVLTISDPELLKQVMVKDFPVFVNRRKREIPDKVDSRVIFILEDEDWKRVRAIVSPTFTSGKLKRMNLLMNQCVNKLVDYFEKVCRADGGIINTKEVIAGFTVDVIASTFFGTETDANGDGKKQTPFLYHGLGFSQINPLRVISDLLMPMPVKRFVNYLFPQVHRNFFRQLSRQVVKHRRETNFKRNDFVQLLMDAHLSESDLQNTKYDQLTASDDKDDDQKDQTIFIKSKNTNCLDDDEIIAQCIVFFIAGFETTASTLSNCLFELAQNPQIQDRLSDELNSSLADYHPNSEQYYDTVMNQIPYLEAVIKETLRKYPPAPRIERRVGVDNYQMAGFTLQKDQLVAISIYAVHHNPEYYPDPERYNPDRFMPENKHLLVPYTYLPFTLGPRNCVGMRFAYQELKLGLAKIVAQFRFIPTEETPEKLEFAKFGLGLINVRPFPLKIVKRQ